MQPILALLRYAVSAIIWHEIDNGAKVDRGLERSRIERRDTQVLSINAADKSAPAWQDSIVHRR